MKSRTLIILSIAVMIIALSAIRCTPAKTIDLDGTTWTVYTLGGEVVNADGDGTLNFDEEQVNGVAFCNQFFGPYEVDGSKLSFGMLGSTMMACPESQGPEGEYLKALAEVKQFNVDGDSLVLQDADGSELIVLRPTQHAELEGTDWIVTGYYDGSGFRSVIIDTEITAKLDDEKVEGTAGCNHYFGAYSVDGNDIAFSDIANTEMACMEPEGVMDQEMHYLKALRQTASFEIDRNRVSFIDEDGMRLISYIVAD